MTAFLAASLRSSLISHLIPPNTRCKQVSAPNCLLHNQLLATLFKTNLQAMASGNYVTYGVYSGRLVKTTRYFEEQVLRRGRTFGKSGVSRLYAHLYVARCKLTAASGIGFSSRRSASTYAS